MEYEFEEREYQTNLPIKFVLQRGIPGSKHLVIVFSGFAGKEDPIQHKYNYMRTLQNIKCNKLFILDNYGPRGCYYIGHAMSYEVETSVMSLISHIMNKLGIGFNDIISAGTSKGGAVALYYGLKYNFGNIIIGSPQTFIGEYVTYVAKDTADYIMGDKALDENRKRLNQLVFLQLEKEFFGEMRILTSTSDWHHEKHLLPFINECNKRNIPVKLLLDERIKEHGDIGTYYPEFLVKNVLELVFGIVITASSAGTNNNSVYFDTIITTGESFEIKITNRVMKDNSLLKLIEGARVNSTPLATPGILDLYTDLMIDGERIYTIEHGKFLFGGSAFDYHGYSISIVEKNLRFALIISEKVPLQFAFYVVKDGKTVEKIWYSEQKEILVPLNDSGNYRVDFFILMPSGEKVIHRSDTLKYQS